MTVSHVANSAESDFEEPLEVARAFGDVPSVPFEYTPEQVVLSSEAHSRLAGRASVSQLGGPFSYERIGAGVLTIHETDMPGQVHVRADVRTENGPIVHLDADVRKSWLDRTTENEDVLANAEVIVNELLRMLELPRQSTVTVSVD